MAGRNPKVCAVCLGNAETTDDKCKCNGKFGDAKCNDWLWGWFLVDDTVERASKSHNTAMLEILEDFDDIKKSVDIDSKRLAKLRDKVLKFQQ